MPSPLLAVLLVLLPLAEAQAKGVPLALPSAARPEPVSSYLHPSLEEKAYYQNKMGFRSITLARDHAFKEFKKGVRLGGIVPTHKEYFSYIYMVDGPGGQKGLYFHSPWEQATFLQVADGNEQYCVQTPFPDGDRLRKITMLHSHPTSNSGGDGPSRMDVVLASNYKKEDGRFRYLYLITNHQKLVKFKAMRVINPAGAKAIPARPVRGRHWQD